MARRTVNTENLKISFADETLLMLEAMTKLGIYGKSPTEVARKMVEEGIERVVYRERALELAGLDVRQILGLGKGAAARPRAAVKRKR